MRENRLLDAVRVGNNMMMLISKESSNQVALYKVSPCASYMSTAQLTNDMIEAYERYYRAIRKNMNSDR